MFPSSTNFYPLLTCSTAFCLVVCKSDFKKNFTKNLFFKHSLNLLFFHTMQTKFSGSSTVSLIIYSPLLDNSSMVNFNWMAVNSPRNTLNLAAISNTELSKSWNCWLTRHLWGALTPADLTLRMASVAQECFHLTLAHICCAYIQLKHPTTDYTNRAGQMTSSQLHTLILLHRFSNLMDCELV